MHRRGRSSIRVSVDAVVYLSDIDDHDLEAEFYRRNPARTIAANMDLVQEAREELLRNRPNHALALLERACFPTKIEPVLPNDTRLMQLPTASRA